MKEQKSNYSVSNCPIIKCINLLFYKHFLLTADTQRHTADCPQEGGGVRGGGPLPGVEGGALGGHLRGRLRALRR